MMLLQEHYPVCSIPALMRMMTLVKMMMTTTTLRFLSRTECDLPKDALASPPASCPAL